MEQSFTLHTEIPNNPMPNKLPASPATASLVNGDFTYVDNSNIESSARILEKKLTSESTLSTEESSKKARSQDFSEQIRKLEIEGNKLRAITASSLSFGTFGPAFGSAGNCLSFNNSFEFPKTFSSPSLGYLSSITDTSADQKYIAELSSTNQQSPGKSAFSTYPSSHFGPTLTRKSLDYLPASHLEKSLKESQEQIMELRKKLQEVTDSSDHQKRQFCQTVEELKSKLHETIQNRDAVLDLRHKESNSQELLIHKLQSALMQLQDHNRLQEEALMSASKQIESVKHMHETNETALSQISCILLDREKSHGHTYFKSDLISGQNTSILVHTLERCLRDLDSDLELKSKKLAELESERDIMKKSLTERERNIARDYQEMIRKEKDEAFKKIAMVTAEHERNMASVSEKLAAATNTITSLESRIQKEEETYHEKFKFKEIELKEMEEKLIELKTENMKNTASWQEKLIQVKHEQVYTETLRQALETSLDQVQKELIETKAEKNELIHSLSVAESRLEDLQSLIMQLESDLETERDRVQQQRLREEELRSELMTMELQISNKQGEIERLERMLEMVKQECSLQVLEKQNLLSSTEKMEKEHYIDQIKNLSSQLASATDKYNKTTMELQTAFNEKEKLKSDLDSLTRKYDKARSQGDIALADKADLITISKDKSEQIDRLLKDKDNYVRQTSEEINHLKVQLEEKEIVLSTLRQQSCSIAQLMEIHSKASDGIREEKEKLAAIAVEKELLLQELRTTVDSLNSQLKQQGETINKLEEVNSTLNTTLQQKIQEINLSQEEKKLLQGELTQIKANMEVLTSKKDALKKEVIKTKTLYTKEVTKLQAKLKECEQEKRLSVKALKSKDIIDNKAVRFADKIQKEMTVKRSEVDQLTSKLHRVEEKLHTVTREKSLIEKDKDNLKKSLAKSLQNSQELSNKLESSLVQNSDLLARLSQMEKDMEQRSSTYQTKMETFEQQIAKLKLKHQLELKEVQGLVRNKSENSTVHHHKVLSSVKQKLLACDNGKDVNESDPPFTRSYQINVHSRKSPHSIELGRELKSLLGEMKTLVSEQAETEDLRNAIARDRPKVSKMKERQNYQFSTLQIPDLRVGIKHFNTDTNKLSSSRSVASLTDLSETYSYTGAGNFLASDTQELCRRLEEKIENLTKMGGNLIKENQDMADLINLQGEKINTVKQMEQMAW